MFEAQHQCNQYCKLFDLPSDYDHWPANGLEDEDIQPVDSEMDDLYLPKDKPELEKSASGEEEDDDDGQESN
jgi:hypothetical protein